LAKLELTNINILKSFYWSQHLLKFVSIVAREKSSLHFKMAISQCPNLMSKKIKSWKRRFIFPRHCKWHLISFTFTSFCLNINIILLRSFLVNSLVFANISKIFNYNFHHFLNLQNHFHIDAHDDISKAQKIRNFLIMLLNNVAMPCSQPMNEDTRQKILFLRSITKLYHQWKHIMNFFFPPHTSLENERKEENISTKQTSFLTLIAISTHNQISNHFSSSFQ
jgi:hypothetical protein